MQVKVSFVKNNRDNSPVDKTLSLEEFQGILSTFVPSFKEEAPGMIGGHFGGKKRLLQNLQYRTLLTLDVDSYNGSINDLEVLFKRDLNGYRYMAYTTASSSLNKPKIRIILFLNQNIAPADYKILSFNFIRSLSEEFQLTIDIKASTQPNQLMYLPIKPCEEYAPWFRHSDGKYINPADYLQSISLESSEEDLLLTTTRNSPLSIDNEGIKAYLSRYPVEQCDYYQWVEVGAALHHQYQGDENGLYIWNEWSKKDSRSGKYKGLSELVSKWGSFHSDNDNPVTFATIIYKTKNNPKKNSDMNIPIYRDKWKDTKGKYKSPLFTEANFKILLEEYNIRIAFDVIKKNVEIWFNDVKCNDLNVAVTRIKFLCKLNSLESNPVNEAVALIGNQNTFNSWQDWVYSAPWDGVKRFDEFCKTVEVSSEYEEVRNLFLKKWFLQLVNVTCLNDDHEAKVARMILVFQGKQYSGKTSWFRSLVPYDHNEFVTEATSLKISDSMNVLRCIRHVMVELGEINSTMKKSDSEELKNFLSSTKDTLNIKYVAYPITYRRRTVFFGSVNENEFLYDQTDNTRFLCLPILNCNYRHNMDMQQIYAELIEMTKEDNNYFLTHEDLEIQQKMNVNFKSISILEEKLLEIFDIENKEIYAPEHFTILNATNLLEELGFHLNQMIHKKNLTNEMAKVLDSHKLKRSAYPRGWYLPPKKLTEEF